MRRAEERGQALPLLVAVLVLAAGVALVVVDLGVAAVHRAQARTAADAAALAGAAAGADAAGRAAAANGGELVSYVADGPIVEVVVVHGPARARATAEGSVVSPSGLAPALAAAVARAEQVLGRPIEIVDIADEGMAIVVDPGVADDLAAVEADTGLCRQTGSDRPVHFVPCPPSSPA